jgi:hypothetical protein
VLQGFTSRVCALFYAAMRRRKYIDVLDGADAMDVVSEKIQFLTPAQFCELVEDVRVAAFTLQAWRNGTDIEYRTMYMCRILQETELFLIVRHAIKHADIGLLRYVVDPLIILFFGAGQNNYGHEMLFYRWNLSSVNAPELQHAILASGLVNWVGLPNSNKAIDLGLEHLNGNAKIEMKCYKNSTHDANIVFNRVCLSNTWTRALREKLEETFGEQSSGKHTVASAELDMFLLARNLFVGGLAERRPPRQSAAPAFDAVDIRLGGMMVLAAKVEAFNEQHVRRAGTVVAAAVDTTEAVDEFADIEAYAEEFEDGLDE